MDLKLKERLSQWNSVLQLLKLAAVLQVEVEVVEEEVEEHLLGHGGVVPLVVGELLQQAVQRVHRTEQ